MKKRFLTFLILAFAGLIAIAGCSPQNSEGQADSDGGELYYGFSSEPATLNPLSSGNTADGRSILFNVFEGLVKSDTGGNLQMALASSVDIGEGGKIYDFTLREGIKFHNGADLKPADVKYSLEEAAKSGLTGLDQIVDINAEGNHVTLTLAEPNTFFLSYLTIGVVPEGYTDFENAPVGTGPFKIESYTPQQSLVLVKNPDYWQSGLPHLDKVIIQFFTDTTALTSALQSGAIGGATVTYASWEQLSDSVYTLSEAQSASVQLLALNNAVAPFDNIQVRQALNYAIDVDGIIDSAFYGYGTKTRSPVIPGLKTFHDSSIDAAYPYDLDKANQLLTEAGYGDGFDLTITVPSNYTMHVDTAQVLVNQLAKVNINVKIEQVDWATWLSNVYQGRQYEATIISLDGALAPSSFLSRYRSESSSNFVNYNNPAYDEVYAAALAELDDAKRVELYNSCQQILSDDAVSVYIQDISSLRVLDKNFEGMVDYPLYVFDFSTIQKVSENQ